MEFEQPQVPKRGTALVEQHYERQQQEKETQALETISALVPMLGPKIRILALQECKWDVDRTTTLLRKFQSSNFEELQEINEERERRKEQGEAQAQQKAQEQAQVNKLVLPTKPSQRKSARSMSSSEDGSSISSGSDIDSGDSDMSVGSEEHNNNLTAKNVQQLIKEQQLLKRLKKKEEKEKKHKKEKVKQKSSKDKVKKKKKDKKQKKKEVKKDKKHKKEAKELKRTNAFTQQQYGKFGIIREMDIYQKKREFYSWAMDVKGLDIENMPKFEEKNLFKDYIEDYNTGTLPHEKYYDLEVWEKREYAKKIKTGKSQLDNERLFFDDEAERRKETIKQKQNYQQERLQEAYHSMQLTDKAKDMKEQQMLRLQMTLAYQTGDMEKAAQIKELLKPEDQKVKNKDQDR